MIHLIVALLALTFPLSVVAQQDSKPPAVSVVEAKLLRLVERIPATGSITARNEVLISPEVEGLRIVELLAEEGDTVVKGQVLARLSREVTEAQLAQNVAAIASAVAAEAEARAALERARALTRTGAGSEAALEQRIAAAQAAKAQVDQAQAQRREIEWRLSRTEIKASVEGVLSQRNARIGQIASAAGEPMFRLIAKGELDLEADVEEADLRSIQIGQKAQVMLADGGTITGTVRLIAPRVEEASRLGKVKIALPPDSGARVGNFARASIIAQERDGVAAPLSSLLFSGTQSLAQVVENGKVVTRKVETGILDGGNVEIRSGLQAGETLVLRAGSFLREGDKVRAVTQGNG